MGDTARLCYMPSPIVDDLVDMFINLRRNRIRSLNSRTMNQFLLTSTYVIQYFGT